MKTIEELRVHIVRLNQFVERSNNSAYYLLLRNVERDLSLINLYHGWYLKLLIDELGYHYIKVW